MLMAQNLALQGKKTPKMSPNVSTLAIQELSSWRIQIQPIEVQGMEAWSIVVLRIRSVELLFGELWLRELEPKIVAHMLPSWALVLRQSILSLLSLS